MERSSRLTRRPTTQLLARFLLVCVAPAGLSFICFIFARQVLQSVAVCCSELQWVAVCCRFVIHLFHTRTTGVAECCSVLQCVAVSCSELQWVAVCCRFVIYLLHIRTTAPYTLSETLFFSFFPYSHDSSIYTHRNYVYTQKSPVHMQKSPVYTQKSLAYTHKSPMYGVYGWCARHRCLQVLLYAHTSPVYTQMSPIYTQTGPIYLYLYNLWTYIYDYIYCILVICVCISELKYIWPMKCSKGRLF